MLHSCFWLFVMQTTFHVSSAASNETDRLSLIAFKAQIRSDPLGALNSWNESTHFCKWYGVSCSKRHQRVTMLDLSSSELVGSLSPHIGNLSFLKVINLQNNRFRNVIPQEVGRLRRLQMLGLDNNTFSGEAPVNLSSCFDLWYLGIGGNNLTGTIPAEYGLLFNLQVFLVYKNNLVGQIPSFLGNFSSLQEVSGTDNFFHGEIPETLGKLKQLKHLFFGLNSLTGQIPPSIYNLSSLVTLDVPVNRLNGILPPDLGITLPNIESFNIHTNDFTGQIPITISNASKISLLELAHNGFLGKVPSLAGMNRLRQVLLTNNSLGTREDDDLEFLSYLLNCSDLEVLSLTSNNFGGVLPEYLSNFSRKLRGLTLGSNNIRGTVPVNIGNLIGLTVLGLEQNQLTGAIPSSIGELQNLNQLNLNENDFSGTIPATLGNISSLQILILLQSNLSGSIPSSLGNFRSMLYMDLSRNSLSGTIPKEIMKIQSFSIAMILSHNQLNGSIPTEVGNLVNLGFMDLSDNMLSGETPIAFGSCRSLETLNLARNHLQGKIPESLRDLKAIGSLDLSLNNLSGKIPHFLVSLRQLQNLNLSFNNFEGDVPTQGVFNNATAISLAGNNKLCGEIRELNLPLCAVKVSKHKGSSNSSLKLIIPIVSAVFLLILVLLLTYFTRFKKMTGKTGPSPNRLPPLPGSFLQVSYEDLLKATDGFSSNKIIGSGRFASVFKGTLEDGKDVAVKLLDLQVKGSSKSFLAECSALKNIRHRNLLRIITACDSVDFKGMEFKAPVYEFMINGALDAWLHEPQKTLSLVQRLNIGIDVASAICYLHHHCEPPVVHCDLKPSNVLLDGDLTGHVGDFGLAKLLQDSSLIISSNGTSSLAGIGTMGYVAPEYGMGGDVTPQSDVYSFGILLLEMFTGKRPTHEMFQENLNLHSFVKSALSETDPLSKITDQMLIQEIEEWEEKTTGDCKSPKSRIIGVDKVQDCLVSIFEIGVACSAELPKHRMEISLAEDRLRNIHDQLVKK